MIYFDIDDTLMDYAAAESRAAESFYQKYQSEMREVTDFPAEWAEASQKHMNRYLAGEISFQQQRRERLRHVLIKPLTDQQSDQLFAEYYAIFQDSWCLFPDVKAALDQLKIRRLGIISNGDHAQQKSKLSQLGILHYFDIVITPDIAGCAKPAAEVFLFAAKHAGVKPQDCIYIGDHFQKDYQAAKESGFSAFWLNRSGSENRQRDEVSSLLEFADRVMV